MASRLIGNHPLPDGNERVGYLCLLEFIAREEGRGLRHQRPHGWRHGVAAALGVNACWNWAGSK